MNEIEALQELGERLLTLPKPGTVTDYTQAHFQESITPNTSNAWTHVVPALAKYAKCKGKRSLFGRDKEKSAFWQLLDKLRVVVLALYADGLILQGASTDECLSALIRSLVSFKEVYPNWTDAYSAGYTVFVTHRKSVCQVITLHQQGVESELF